MDLFQSSNGIKLSTLLVSVVSPTQCLVWRQKTASMLLINRHLEGKLKPDIIKRRYSDILEHLEWNLYIADLMVHVERTEDKHKKLSK